MAHSKKLVLLLLICIVGCSTLVDDPAFELELPKGFPQPEIPANNKLSLKRVALGERLFFEPLLSRDTSMSCAFCHHPDLAFSDSLDISPGVNGKNGFRNAPSLVNTAYLKNVNKDGGVIKLGLQAFVPIEDHDEMDISILKVIERLKSIPEYDNLSQEAYGRSIDPFTISRSLAAFQRTLISGNSKYDQFVNGDSAALNEIEKKGMDLFFSPRTSCSSCHSGFYFSNLDFIDNGTLSEHEDQGRKRVTGLDSDMGKFRVQSLRNVELTAPYMHDGGLESLEEVIEHYNSGGKQSANKDQRIRPLGLEESEKKAIIAFLKSLTDWEFIEKQVAKYDINQ